MKKGQRIMKIGYSFILLFMFTCTVCIVAEESSISGQIKPTGLSGGAWLVDDKGQTDWEHYGHISSTTGEFLIRGVKPGVYSILIALDGRLNVISAINTGGLYEIPREEEQNSIKQFFTTYEKIINTKEIDSIMMFYTPTSPEYYDKRKEMIEWLDNLKGGSFSQTTLFIRGNNSRAVAVSHSRFEPIVMKEWESSISNKKNSLDLFHVKKENEQWKIVKNYRLSLTGQLEYGNYPLDDRLPIRFVSDRHLSEVKVIAGRNTCVGAYIIPSDLVKKARESQKIEESLR